MLIKIHISCECGSDKELSVTDSELSKEGEIDLSESIEQNSEGLFYCSQNYPDGMDINCVKCGESKKMIY